MKNKLFSQLRLLFICFLLFAAGAVPVFAQDFNQKIEWSSDPNVLEYKVDVQDKSGKIIKSVTTENNSVSLSLGEGRYKYRITAYDFLGREAVSTKWIDFEVVIAKQPAIEHKKEREALKEDGKTLEMAVNVDDVTSETSVELVNVDTGEKISGKLNVAENKSAPSSLTASETHKADKVQFEEVPEGNWKLVITNPSGLSSETESFEVKDVIKEEKLAAQKAEEERIAREKKAEEERLAREEAERKERERLEAERLAREEEERKERERIAAEIKAREEAEKQERLRIAEEIRAREEAERLAREEAERLAREEEERKEQERIAAEQERIAKEEAEQKKREKRLAPANGLNIMVGSGLILNLLDSQFLNLKNIEDSIGFENPLFLAPEVSISYVPKLKWRFRPGIGISAYNYAFTNQSAPYKHGNGQTDEFEFQSAYNITGVQGELIGQLQIATNKFFINAKAGGGVEFIIAEHRYPNTSDTKQNGFIYPKVNAGLSAEWAPVKHLVFEIGMDYNMIISQQVENSYLKPYLRIGGRL